MSIDGGLRPIFREHLRSGFHWQSVETGATGLGCPDSNYCGKMAVLGREYGINTLPETVEASVLSAEGWIEYKQTSGWDCTLRPEQVGWNVKRSMMGGRVFVATRRWHEGGPRKGPPVDELWLHWGGHARELKDGGVRAAPAYGMWHGGPSCWDWDAVRHALLTRGLAPPG